MVLPAFIIDANSGETISRFGIEVDVPAGWEPPYKPERWCLVTRYTVRAPAGHPWLHWLGALSMLAAVFALIVSHLP